MPQLLPQSIRYRVNGSGFHYMIENELMYDVKVPHSVYFPWVILVENGPLAGKRAGVISPPMY